MDVIESIADALLYEGYVLWPYRRSARKNQQRWTLGGVYPRDYSETSGTGDPWLMQTQCLVVGAAPVLTVKVRFLQVVERRVGRQEPDGTLTFVDELHLGGERYLAWEEAVEREVAIEGLQIADLASPRRVEIAIPAGEDVEPLAGTMGEAGGALVRRWGALVGAVDLAREQLMAELFRLTATIVNTTPWSGPDRASALRLTFVSTHTLLQVGDGAFVSLTDPPVELREEARTCQNLRTWPVLVGEEGETHTLLSSPIILYDYPRVALESPGNLFDGTEIDQLLTLSILGLADEEKAEMRASDPKTRGILERTEALKVDDFMQLHGVIREFQALGGEEPPGSLFAELERPAPASVVVDGVEIGPGSRVRLRPHPGGDIMDIALAGRLAVVEAIEQDYEDQIHLAVTVEDDPGRDLGAQRQPGHRFFFGLDEVEAVTGGKGAPP